MSTSALFPSKVSLQESSFAPEHVAAPARGCRFCDAPLAHIFVDLGVSPLCESYLSADQLDGPETFYPLAVYVCERCLLVQLPVFVSGEDIFSEYAYFSSYSTSYLTHARHNAETQIMRFGITDQSHVVEIASNDGYLLRNFVQRGISCLGIEPAANIARVAQQQGIPTLVKFFGEQTASEVAAQRRADVLFANNVLAHIPDVNDFVRGIKIILAEKGIGVFEIQYLPRLIERNQFDTIYHEHFYYYTLGALSKIMTAHDLTIFDAEEVPTHGGSIRIYVRHVENHDQRVQPDVARLLEYERAVGLDHLAGYEGFASKVEKVKRDLLEFLITAKKSGKTVAGYGAPGKGNTLLNYCGIRQDLLSYTVDRNPYKHGRFLPGTRIPIHAPQRIAETRPDYVLILPWNLRDEIAEQLAYVADWGGRLVVPIPELEIL